MIWSYLGTYLHSPWRSDTDTFCYLINRSQTSCSINYYFVHQSLTIALIYSVTSEFGERGEEIVQKCPDVSQFRPNLSSLEKTLNHCNFLFSRVDSSMIFCHKWTKVSCCMSSGVLLTTFGFFTIFIIPNKVFQQIKKVSLHYNCMYFTPSKSRVFRFIRRNSLKRLNGGQKFRFRSTTSFTFSTSQMLTKYSKLGLVRNWKMSARTYSERKEKRST